MSKIFLISSLIFFQSFLWASSEQNEKIPEVLVEIHLSTFKNNNQNILALTYRQALHWHTYWKNPGDAGLPTNVEIEGLEIEELEWPIPSLFRENGDIHVIGYDGEFTRFFSLPSLSKDQEVTIKSNWLVCKHICIPGQFSKKVTLKKDGIISGYTNPYTVSLSVLKERLKSLPERQEVPNLSHELVRLEDDHLAFKFTLKDQTLKSSKDQYFFPFPNRLITFKREESLQSGSDIIVHYAIEWDGVYEEPPISIPSVGALKSPITQRFLYFSKDSKKPVVIEKTFSSVVSSKKKELTTETTLNVINPKSTNDSIWVYLFLAFFGGIILNVMPCVLPVISIKLFGLAAHSNESKKMIFKHNAAYTVGVLFSFFILASVVVLLKKAGESVGWGFQLQSPHFVAFMIVVLTLFAFNLFGLFEFKTPGGRKLGNLNFKKGFVGDFLGGVLATILSTPCSAPFLGTALTFAFSESTFILYIIFLFIGLGLSFPFILTALNPELIKKLPRPGFWMEKVKKVLGFTLILTVIWLLDVFNMQTSEGNLSKLITILAFSFFAFYFQPQTKSKKVQIFLHLIPIISFAYFISKPSIQDLNPTSFGDNALIERKSNKGLTWEKWNLQKTLDNAKNKKLTFIDFTANWCITCKVNEKLVLETQLFKELVKKHDIELLLGDWTKKDPAITEFLKAHGFVGVPAYFLINKKGELVVLGETVSIKEIEKFL